jgi:hypothetical protein
MFLTFIQERQMIVFDSGESAHTVHVGKVERNLLTQHVLLSQMRFLNQNQT